MYVFKTSVKTKKAIRQLRPGLNALLVQSKWNFDLEDCDNILRIDTQNEVAATIIKLLQNYGFDCEEL